MNKKLLLGVLIIIVVVLPAIVSCASTTTSTNTSASTSQITTAVTAKPATTSAAPARTNWWDKFGTPKYGGTISIRGGLRGIAFDPHWLDCANMYVYEPMFMQDWTVSPDVHPFVGEFAEPQYYAGLLAEKWEQSSPLVFTVHLRQGIHFQNKAPVNGRELVADDVVYNYNRIMGKGPFSEPNGFLTSAVAEIDKVAARDKYTVDFTLKAYSDTAILQIMYGGDTRGIPILAHEIIEQNLIKDWKGSIGTGPWLLEEEPSTSGQTYVRNPDYWGYDQRHPENKLPYADTLKIIGIADNSTALAAMRTGKIDLMVEQRGNPTLAQAASLKKTNPDIQQGLWPVDGSSLDLRCDKTPFTDIKVRKALQLAIDFKTIASSHYLGKVDPAPAGLINPMHKGFVVPYSEWPADLQAEYSYNPEKAKALLAEAGYQNGFKTNCVAAADDDIELLQIMKDELKSIGVEMEINVMQDMPTFMNYCRDSKNDQMAFFLTTGMSWPPIESLRFRVTGYERNFVHNDDPVYDAMYDKVTKTASIEDVKLLSKETDMYAIKQHWTVGVLPCVMTQFWQPWLKAYDSRRIGGGSPTMARLWINMD